MILNGEEVKQKLLEGINLVADTVKPTLGPQPLYSNGNTTSSKLSK